eukprot:4133782-Alexandrium_andersonii.AAC.1
MAWRAPCAATLSIFAFCAVFKIVYVCLACAPEMLRRFQRRGLTSLSRVAQGTLVEDKTSSSRAAATQ